MLLKVLIPLTLLIVVFSSIPERVVGFYLSQRNDLRENSGRLYTTQDYLQRVEEMRNRALAIRHDLRLAEEGIRSLDELLAFLKLNSSVLLSRDQFISIYRWLPRDHAALLVSQEDFINLLYAGKLASVACDYRAGFVAFDFLNSDSRSLRYIEVADRWFHPNRSGLVFLSRQRDIELLQVYPGYSPELFYNSLDSLELEYHWQFDRSFLTDMADRLYYIAMPSSAELLIVTQQDSLFDIWRYTPGTQALEPTTPWWER